MTVKEMQYSAPLRELKKGDFFTKRDIACPSEAQVWIRGDYDRSAKRYECTRFSDFCDVQMMPGDKIVFCGFTF